MSGTVTFLFTDIEGSTRLLHELGVEEYSKVLGEHHRVCRAAWRAHDGFEVDTAGDAFFVVFEEAAQAVGAAAEAQAALEELGLRVRMGLHTGHAHVAETGYVGAEVHRAARVGASGHGGQVLVSEATAAHLGGVGELTSLGRHRLKDFDEPVEVFQLGESLFPPLKTIANTNLPTPASSFVGREAELRDAGNLLVRSRVVTVTGPGGTGKTRFALELARRAREERFSDYRDGVFWVPLASLRDPALVLNTVANVLGASDDLATFVGTKRLLLVLDNLEQVLASARDLSRLVSSCPHLTLVCTSRELLRIGGERAYDLRPLVSEEGVILFSERSGLEPSDAMAELSRRLDGLPLALELAAARARILTVEQILERLSDRLDLFLGGSDTEPRQATLRATIAWSHDLLEPRETRLFARLAVFSGGCRLEAAEEIADADLDTLQSLLDKSLLRKRYDGDGTTRFWMLETIREFALEQLVRSGDGAELTERHASWYADLTTPPDGYNWAATTERIDLLEGELDNLRAVLERAVHDADSTRALEVALGLFPVWEMRDRLSEGDLWLNRALALGHADDMLKGQALGARSALLYHLGRTEAARHFASEAADILRVTGPESELAMVLLQVTWGQWETSLPEALVTAEEALLLARRSGSSVVKRAALHCLGELEAYRGMYDRGALLLEEALQVSRDLGEAGFVVAISHSLGDLELRRDNNLPAWSRYLESGSLGISERVPQQVGLCVGGLAAVAARQGRSALASRLWAAVEEWERQRGAPLHPQQRKLYETALAAVPAGDGQPPLTLEQAIGIALADQ